MPGFEILSTFRNIFLWSSNALAGQGISRDHASLPAHRFASPKKSLLREPREAVASSSKSIVTTTPPRSVTFYESVEGKEISSPLLFKGFLNSKELAAKDKRAKAYDEMWKAMRRAFLRPDRFVKHLSFHLSPRRRKIATESSLEMWKHIAEKRMAVALPKDEEEDRHQICLYMIHLMFLKLKEHVFKDLPGAWSARHSEAAILTSATILARRTARFFLVFRKDPFGPDSTGFTKELLEVCMCAYRLRALLSPTKKYTFQIYVPLKKDRERRLALLQNRLHVYETIGADRLGSNDREAGLGLVHMALCGGLMRKAKNLRGPKGKRPQHSSVCERKAVCIAYHPLKAKGACGKLLNAEEMNGGRMMEAHMKALELEEEVKKF